MPVDGLAYDPVNHIIPNEFGCVLSESGQMIPGLYVAGWAKRGAVGIVDATLRDTKQTFGVIRHHLEANMLPESKLSIPDLT